MKVKELKNLLEYFDDEMEVRVFNENAYKFNCNFLISKDNSAIIGSIYLKDKGLTYASRVYDYLHKSDVILDESWKEEELINLKNKLEKIKG